MEAQAVQRKERKGKPAGRRPRPGMEGQHETVAALLRRSNGRSTLDIGRPDDRFEREADRVSERVLKVLQAAPSTLDGPPSGNAHAEPPGGRSLPRPPSDSRTPMVRSPSSPGPAARSIQRLAAGHDGSLDTRPEVPEEWPEAEEWSEQSFVVGRKLAEAIAAIRHGGRPLPRRSAFEAALGYDLGTVRIHTDGPAERVARMLGARAFTAGRDIAFGAGEFAPDTPEGVRLIAHELTHVVQQGAHGGSLALEERGLTEGSPAAVTGEPMSSSTAPQLQPGLRDDAAALWNRSRAAVTETAREVGSAVASGARYVGGKVAGGARAVVDTAVDAYQSVRDLVIGYLEEHAPELLAFLRGDIVGEIKRRIFQGLDTLFNGFGQRIQREGLVPALRGVFGEFTGSVSRIATDLAAGNCGALFEAVRTVAAFGERLMGPAFDDIRALLSGAGEFLGGLWNDFGAPAVEVLRELAGGAWEWISDKARWLWDQTAGVRGLLAGAWAEFKRIFNLAWDDAGDVLSWLRDKAQEAWDAIKEELGPYLLPLQIAAGVFALFTPMGPIVAIGVGGPLLWQGIGWLRENWDNIGIVVRAREVLHQQILPAIQSGMQWFQGVLQAASDWLTSMMAQISAAVTGLLASLGALPILGALFRAVSRLADRVTEAVNWFLDELVALLRDLKQLAIDFLTLIRPIAVLIGAILIFPVNPFILTMVLAGWAWRIAPECVKPPIIDFFIDCAIAVIRAMPDFANFGDAWPRAKNTIIESLETARTRPMEEKVAMSNRVARMMTGEDFSWIGNLIAAAREMPDHFWGEAQQELIGMDLTQPLPFERTEAATPSAGALHRAAESLEPGLERRLLQSTLADDEVEIDRVAFTDWDPELVAALNIPDGGVHYIGDGEGDEGSLELGGGEVGPGAETALGPEDVEGRLQEMMNQPMDLPCDREAPSSAREGQEAARGSEFPEAMKFGPLTQGQRARYLLDRMGKGIAHWFDCNKHWVVPSLILAIVALIALEILTEGAITAALPAIAEILGLIFVGIAFVRVAYYLAEYLALGTIGQVTDAAKALARGLAVGAIELIFAFLFNIDEVIRAVRGGAKAAAQSAMGAARGMVTRGVEAVGELGRTVVRGTTAAGRNLVGAGRAVIRGGRVVLSGVQDGIGSGVRSLGQLLRRLRSWLREFRGFRFKRRGRWLLLQALFNPWVTIARGRAEVTEEGRPGAVFLTDEELAALRRGGEPGTGPVRPFEVVDYATTRAPRRGQPPGTGGRRGLPGDRLTGDHVPSRAALLHAMLEEQAGRQLTRDEARRVWDALTDAEQLSMHRRSLDDGVTVVLREGDHATLSRTYAGRNTEAQILRDARDLGGAFRRDVEAILRGLYNDGRLTPEIVGAYMRAYRENVRRGVFRYNPDVDEMMRDFLMRLRRRGGSR